MTHQQKEMIKQHFFNPQTNNDAWRKVVENTTIAFRWRIEEQIIRLVFVEKLPIYISCNRLHISKRCCYYSLNHIYDTAFMWAREFGVL